MVQQIIQAASAKGIPGPSGINGPVRAEGFCFQELLSPVCRTPVSSCRHKDQRYPINGLQMPHCLFFILYPGHEPQLLIPDFQYMAQGCAMEHLLSGLLHVLP